jgi:hypothetical protein
MITDIKYNQVSYFGTSFNENDTNIYVMTIDNFYKQLYKENVIGMTMLELGLAKKTDYFANFIVLGILDPNIQYTTTRSITLDVLYQLQSDKSDQDPNSIILMDLEFLEYNRVKNANKLYMYQAILYTKFRQHFKHNVLVYQTIIYGPNVPVKDRQTNLGSTYYAPNNIYLKSLLNKSYLNDLILKLSSGSKGSRLELIVLARIAQQFIKDKDYIISLYEAGTNPINFESELCDIFNDYFLHKYIDYLPDDFNPEIQGGLDVPGLDNAFKKSLLISAREEGREEGREGGLKEGLEKGREGGLKEGLEKGLEKGLKLGQKLGKKEGVEKYKVGLAKKFLKLGWSRQQICAHLDVTEDWFQSVKKPIA